MGGANELKGPDLSEGADVAALGDGVPLLGDAGGEAVMLVRRGKQLFAVGATCTHYSGPLAEGLVEGERVHCPWHHACFDLRTGEAVGPPALNPIACYRVEEQGGRAFVREKLTAKKKVAPAGAPSSVAIVGAGTAGNAAAEMLRREGYEGSIVMLGAEATPPIDRPNLSKDYLAGTAPEEWMALRGPEFYAEQKIDFRAGARVTAIDPANKTLTLGDGSTLSWSALVLATGATVNRLDLPGMERAHTLRTLADSKAIIAKAREGERAVVIGSSFIGLEVAASLIARKMEVHVVGPDALPLERVLGTELAKFVRALHEEKGVRFHLGRKPRAIGEREVELDDGSKLPAELVVAGVGVRPETGLAERAGLRCDKGILVDEWLRTSAPGVFAAGDVARWPWRGKSIRVEHWVVAEQLGQVAALNLLGRKQPFDRVPFFWSQHYDVPINYVGHCERPERIEVAGNVAERNCVVAYWEGGRIAAMASIYRDRESLEAAEAFRRDDDAALEAIVKRVRG